MSSCDCDGEASGAAPGLGRVALGVACGPSQKLSSLLHPESLCQISLEERLLLLKDKVAVVVETDLALKPGATEFWSGFPAHWLNSRKVTSPF